MRGSSSEKVTVLSFNPLSLSYGRLEDVIDEAANFALIGLQGTQNKCTGGEPTRRHRVHQRLVLEAGWAEAKFSNKSAGCALALPQGSKDSTVKQILVPPPETPPETK